MTGSNQEQGDDPALFAHQDIERAARGTGVHDLEADAGPQEFSPERRRRKNLSVTRAEQDEFGFEGANASDVIEIQVGHRNQFRFGPQGRGCDDHGAMKRFAVDPQCPVAITAYQIEIRVRVLGELHPAKIPNVATGDEVTAHVPD